MTRGFPIIRNRLIAALGEAAVIGETSGTGGTVHFLKKAQERGLPLFIHRRTGEDASLAGAFERVRKRGGVFFDRESDPEELADRMLRAAREYAERRDGDDDMQLRLCEQEEAYGEG